MIFPIIFITFYKNNKTSNNLYFKNILW